MCCMCSGTSETWLWIKFESLSGSKLSFLLCTRWRTRHKSGTLVTDRNMWDQFGTGCEYLVTDYYTDLLLDLFFLFFLLFFKAILCLHSVLTSNPCSLPTLCMFCISLASPFLIKHLHSKSLLLLSELQKDYRIKQQHSSRTSSKFSNHLRWRLTPSWRPCRPAVCPSRSSLSCRFTMFPGFQRRRRAAIWVHWNNTRGKLRFELSHGLESLIIESPLQPECHIGNKESLHTFPTAGEWQWGAGHNQCDWPLAAGRGKEVAVWSPHLSLMFPALMYMRY